MKHSSIAIGLEIKAYCRDMRNLDYKIVYTKKSYSVKKRNHFVCITLRSTGWSMLTI